MLKQGLATSSENPLVTLIHQIDTISVYKLPIKVTGLHFLFVFVILGILKRENTKVRKRLYGKRSRSAEDFLMTRVYSRQGYEAATNPPAITANTDHWTIYTAVFEVLTAVHERLILLPVTEKNSELHKKFDQLVRNIMEPGFERYCYFLSCVEGSYSDEMRRQSRSSGTRDRSSDENPVLTYENRDTEMFKNLQTLFAVLPVDYGLKRDEANKDALIRFEAFKKDQNTALLPDALKPIVFSLLLNPEGYSDLHDVGARSGGRMVRNKEEEELVKSTYNYLLENVIRNPSSDSVHKEIARAAIGGVPADYAEMLVDIWGLVPKETIDKMASPLASLEGSGPIKTQFLWNKIREDWVWVEEYTKKTAATTLQGFIERCVDNFAGEDRAKEIEEFFKDKDVERFADTLKQTVERTRSRGVTLDRWEQAGSLDIEGEFWKEI